MEEKYKLAFRVACELLNGDVLHGISIDNLHEEVVKRGKGCSCFDIEEYILENLEFLEWGK